MLALYSDRVVLGDGVQTPLNVRGAELWIENAVIRAVRPVERVDWVPTENCLDFGDFVVCPAFVNAHTHVALNAFRGLTQASNLRGNMVENLFYRLEEHLTPEDVRSFARMGAHECLDNGVGLIWDHYYGGTELARAIVDVGLAAVVAPTLQDVSGPGVGQLEAGLEATESLDADDWAERGVWPALGPHATDTVSPELWTRVAELARQRDWVVHAHVAQSVEEHERALERHGCSPVELLERSGVLDASGVFVHGIYMSDADLARLNGQRHTLGFCPLSQVQFCFPAYVPGWSRAGLPWFVATDCAPTNDAMNVQRELPLVAAMRSFETTSSPEYSSFRTRGDLSSARALDEARVAALDAAGSFSDPQFLLSRVWSIPGRLHPSMRAGVIEAGALANLLVLDPNHPSFWPQLGVLRTLALGDTRGAIHRLMVRGQWIKAPEERAGERREHAREAQERLEAHLRALNLL